MASKQLWMAAAVVLAAAAVYFMVGRTGREPAPPTPPPPDETPVEKILRETARTPPPVEEPTLVETIVNLVNPTEEPAPSDVAVTGAVLRLNAAMTLATVNGVPITLRDLVPVAPGAAAENSMGREMFAALMDRAVKRELANQQAREQGVALSEEQLRNLESIRRRALERDPNSFTEVHDDFAAKAEFEVRDFAGLMLQESLLAAAGGPPRYVTPEMVDAYYQANQAAFPPLPGDPAEREAAMNAIEIDIRSRLAQDVDAAYQDALSRMTEAWKQQADIRTYVTMESP